MREIVYLYNKKYIPNNEEVDAFLVPLKGLSTRSSFELDIDEIRSLKLEKPLYILCDALISQSELENVRTSFEDIFEVADKIFFQDLSFYRFAKEKGCIDKLVYYSPTLSVNSLEISNLSSLGIENIIISKEASYKDYIGILKGTKNANLGMLVMGYPQIYFSKRKMISSFDKEYNLCINNKETYFIKEKSRDFYQPIIEDERGTYIFAGKIFFPYQYINEFISLGMKYLIFDPLFMDDIKSNFEILLQVLNNENIDIVSKNDFSNFMMFREMVNDYGKKN